MDDLFISALQLNELIDKEIVILDCRFALNDRAAGLHSYTAGHIPGAIYCDLEKNLSSPVSEHGGRHPLPDLGELRDFFAHAGINSTATQQSLVVVYDDSKFAFSARCWWLLNYLGHQNVKLLNGGYRAWCDAGFAVETTINSPQAGSFDERLPPELATIDVEKVKSISTADNANLIDSREEKRFLGIEEPIDPVAGHIPSAQCFPWQEVSDANGFIKDQLFHQSRWQVLPAEKPVVVYCGSGVTACVNLLSLNIAGIKDAKLYPGSWSDWCSYDLPVATE